MENLELFLRKIQFAGLYGFPTGIWCRPISGGAGAGNIFSAALALAPAWPNDPDHFKLDADSKADTGTNTYSAGANTGFAISFFYRPL